VTIVKPTKFRLPFEGRWFVGAAGDTVNVNHHMEFEPQWYGMDFLKVGGPDGNVLHEGSGNSKEEYYSWNEPVLSPVKGKVVYLENMAIDQEIGYFDEENAAGNHVVIQSSPSEFVYIAHFKKASIVVTPGQEVDSGQKLGLCGNSGNSSCPHIHMHVQNKLNPTQGIGQRVLFSNINVTMVGKGFDRVDWPLITGIFVEQANDA